MKKRVLLAARSSVIEPLGLLHLSGVAEEEGWESKIVMVDGDGFSKLNKLVSEFNPDLLGFSVYTGNHSQTFEYLDRLRTGNNAPQVVLGGPHATYFPSESLQHSDFVVLSEGFNGFRRILRGEAEKGIVPLIKQEPFPIPNRKRFYEDYPEHKKSPIKSVIAHTGCPYACTYCYNSSKLDSIALSLSDEQKTKMSEVLGKTRRLFPKSSRTVDDILREIEKIRDVSPETQMIYFQDDVFGEDIQWVREFAKRYPSIGLPFHAQMRFEFANPDSPKSKERIELIRQAGATGLTFAIESADPIIRREVLDRNMDEQLIFKTFYFLNQLGYKVRTEQMLGLPYGATTKPTAINLDADLSLLDLNVRLKKETHLPTMAWVSIFAPYKGTKIGNYCSQYGHYTGENNDIPETFFEKSVLRFPKNWVGPKLNPTDKNMWLSGAEQEEYRNNMQMLGNLFSYFFEIPKGEKLARKFLSKKGEKNFFGLSTATRRHLYDSVLYGVE